MTPVEIAALLKDYGSTGTIALLLAVIVYLTKRWDVSTTDRLADAKVMTAAVTSQTSANLELVELAKGLREGQGAIMALLTEIGRQGVNEDQRLRDKFDDLIKKNDETVRRMESVCRHASGGVRP